MVHKNNKGYKILIYLTAIVLAIFIMIWLDEKNDNPKPEPYKGRTQEQIRDCLEEGGCDTQEYADMHNWIGSMACATYNPEYGCKLNYEDKKKLQAYMEKTWKNCNRERQHYCEGW